MFKWTDHAFDKEFTKVAQNLMKWVWAAFIVQTKRESAYCLEAKLPKGATDVRWGEQTILTTAMTPSNESRLMSLVCVLENITIKLSQHWRTGCWEKVGALESPYAESPDAAFVW